MDETVFEDRRRRFGLHHLGDLRHEGFRSVEVFVHGHDVENCTFLAAALAQPLFTALESARLEPKKPCMCALGEHTPGVTKGAFDYEVLVSEWLGEVRSVATIRVHPRWAEVVVAESGASFRLTGVAAVDLSNACKQIEEWGVFEEMLAMLITSYFELEPKPTP